METTLTSGISDSIETGSLVETKIVRVVSLSKTEITAEKHSFKKMKKKKKKGGDVKEIITLI